MSIGFHTLHPFESSFIPLSSLRFKQQVEYLGSAAIHHLDYLTIYLAGTSWQLICLLFRGNGEFKKLAMVMVSVSLFRSFFTCARQIPRLQTPSIQAKERSQNAN